MYKHLSIALFALISVILGSTLIYGQSSFSFYNGFKPTAAQWNSYFAAKQDYLGYSPVNRAGDSMGGPLILAPSSSTAAGANLTPGSAPSLPNNGDIWTTSAGLYVQINGTTVGPLVGTTISGGFTSGFASVVSAAGTTVLTVNSAQIQETTGSTTQAYTLPVVATLPQAGFKYIFMNKSSGTVTVNSSGSNSVKTIAGGTSATIYFNGTAGTAAASWDVY